MKALAERPAIGTRVFFPTKGWGTVKRDSVVIPQGVVVVWESPVRNTSTVLWRELSVV